jgi:hypothetical protein
MNLARDRVRNGGKVSSDTINRTYNQDMGTAVAQWLRCCVTNRNVSVSIPTGVNGFFIDIKSFRSYYGPRVDSASNRNEYRTYFLGVKRGRCVRLTLTPSGAESGSLIFLEPFGPVQACNGTALPLQSRHSSHSAARQCASEQDLQQSKSICH